MIFLKHLPPMGDTKSIMSKMSSNVIFINVKLVRKKRHFFLYTLVKYSLTFQLIHCPKRHTVKYKTYPPPPNKAHPNMLKISTSPGLYL